MRESMQKSAGPVQRRAKEPAATKTQHENDLAQSARVVMQRKAMGDGFGGASAPVGGGSGRGGLPGNLTRGIAALSGMDLSDVKVHRNSARPAQLKALAFAQNDTIHLGPGQEKHLPHEAWHIVQQRQGRVQADVQMKGGAVNTDSKLEREADIKGAEAAQVGNSMPLAFASTDPGRGSGASNGGVMQLQRSAIEEDEPIDINAIDIQMFEQPKEMDLEAPVDTNVSGVQADVQQQEKGADEAPIDINQIDIQADQQQEEKGDALPANIDNTAVRVEGQGQQKDADPEKDRCFESKDHMPLLTEQEVNSVLGSPGLFSTNHKKINNNLTKFHLAMEKNDRNQAYECLRNLLNAAGEEQRKLGAPSVVERNAKKEKNAKKESNAKKRRRWLMHMLVQRVYAAMSDHKKDMRTGTDKNSLASYAQTVSKTSSFSVSKVAKEVPNAVNNVMGVKNDLKEHNEQVEGTRNVRQNWENNKKERAEIIEGIKKDTSQLTSSGKNGIGFDAESNQIVISYDGILDKIIEGIENLQAKFASILDIFNITKLMKARQEYKESGKVGKRISALKKLTSGGGKTKKKQDKKQERSRKYEETEPSGEEIAAPKALTSKKDVPLDDHAKLNQAKKDGMIDYAILKLSSLRTHLRLSAAINFLKFGLRMISFVSAGAAAFITEPLNFLASAAGIAMKLGVKLKGLFKFVVGTKGKQRKLQAENLYAGVSKGDPNYEDILFALVQRTKVKKFDIGGKVKETAYREVVASAYGRDRAERMHMAGHQLIAMIRVTDFARKEANKLEGPKKLAVSKLADAAQFQIMTTLKGLFRSKPAQQNLLLEVLQKYFKDNVLEPLRRYFAQFAFPDFNILQDLFRVEKR